MMKKAIALCIFTCFFPVFVFSQTAVTIDAALSNSTAYLSGRIPAKTKVVVLNFSSKWPDLSDYIIEELIGYIVNEGTLTVVDRQNLESIRKEMDFQLSGEVSDETAQSIGKKLGAQTIVSGAITAIGNTYRLRIRAISVQTAQILGMQNVDVAQDSRLAALTGTAYTGPTNTQPAQTTQQSTKTQPAAPPAKGTSSNLGTFSFELVDNFKYADGYHAYLTNPRLFNGNKIVKGDTYTLKFTCTASRDMEAEIRIYLVDHTPAANNHTLLSPEIIVPGSKLKAGVPFSAEITLTAKRSATSAKVDANLIGMETQGNGKKGVKGSGKQGPVTLNFTEFVFTKVE